MQPLRLGREDDEFSARAIFIPFLIRRKQPQVYRVDTQAYLIGNRVDEISWKRRNRWRIATSFAGSSLR